MLNFVVAEFVGKFSVLKGYYTDEILYLSRMIIDAKYGAEEREC